MTDAKVNNPLATAPGLEYPAGISLRNVGDASVSVLCCTWNAGNARPAADLAPWIPVNGGGFDIIVVGLQECTYTEKPHDADKDGIVQANEDHVVRDEEDILESENRVDIKLLELQLNGSKTKTTRAAAESKAKAAGSIAAPDLTSINLEKLLIAPVLATTGPAMEIIKAHVGRGYALASSTLMWQIGIMVFVRKAIMHEVTEVQTASEATGLMGITPNKGGVLVKMKYRDSTTLCFVASHLAAHMKHVEHRNLNTVEILNNARLGNPAIDADSQFTHVFWMGDLNYRVDLAISQGGERNKESPEKWAAVQELIQAGKYKELMGADQLRDAVKNKLAFSGFTEGDTLFTPTFKVKRVPGFEHSHQRISSYCDRVLWKSLPAFKDDVKLTAYAAHSSISTSDHKPVSAAFTIAIRPALPASALCVPKGITSKSGALLRVTGLAGRNLLGMDVSGKSDVYALFFSDRELLAGREGKTPKATTQRQTVDPVWPDDQIDDMRIGGAGPADLATAHLWVVLMDKDFDGGDDCMGQVVLPLREAAEAAGKPVKFDILVTKGARQQGRLTGSISIAFNSTSDLRQRKREGLMGLVDTCCSIL